MSNRYSWLLVLLVACGETEPPTTTPEYEPYVPPPAECYADASLGTACTATTPAPQTSTEIAQFIRDSALALHCDEVARDFRALDTLFADQRVFMTGEVHGTNEVGVYSAALFEHFVEEGRIDVLAIELPMEFEADFQDYIDTGFNPVASQFLSSFAPNFFGSILVEKARELRASGTPLTIALVDSPYGTDVPVVKIQELAENLSAYRGLVLDTLPEPLSVFDDYPTDQYITDALIYADSIAANLTDICTELDAQDCDTLEHMALAIWTAMAMFSGTVDEETWFARREEVIYYNLRQKLAANETMYMHMGAFHTNKLELSAGSRLTHEFLSTRDRVISVAAAWGAGSEIYYGGENIPVESSPPVIANALADSELDPHFVATTAPSSECQANPLTDEWEDTIWAPMGDVYDGYFHVRQLTPENRPPDTTIIFSIGHQPAPQILPLWDNVRAMEQRALDSLYR